MSDYGADANPDMAKTWELMVPDGFTDLAKTNVMQWTYPGRVVRKLANKQDATNILFKMEE
jgi:hypothetical protein